MKKALVLFLIVVVFILFAVNTVTITSVFADKDDKTVVEHHKEKTQGGPVEPDPWSNDKP